MHLIALPLVSVALAVFTSALPRTGSERDLVYNAGRAGGGAGKRGDDNNETDPQSSLTLDPRVINSNFSQNGQANATPGQVPSLTSTNNFINFCLTVNFPLTNGQQLKDGSCNACPMGVIAPSSKIPSSKFVTPSNLGAVKANTTFEIKIAIQNLDAGHFTNPDLNYYSAPQQLNSDNVIIGHTHAVVEELPSIDTTDPLDPTRFAFFIGINTPADAQGNVAVNVTGGLPEGVYRVSSIVTSANHVPVLVAVAQRGGIDDSVYIFVTADGNRPAKIV
ncbi:hypothetical protein BJV74DRAFT_455442 [Russula compacta]|nr:hypothetical protein BJV74DRAFT_455442 [Russula compacta]